MANWALIIGINNYQRLRSLNFAERDAQLMQEYCQKEKFEKIFYFSDTSPDFLASDGSWQETRPTFANLYSFLTDFFSYPSLEPGDNFWFFFSGHGIRYEDRDYLMPCDGNPRIVEPTAIPVNYITERLRRCGADNVVLFLDACRNDSGKSGLGIGLEEHQGVITISSCAPSEQSYEIEELQQGAFTYVLLESLRIQGAGNCATVERLCNRLQYRVREINNFYHKPVQTPYSAVEPASKYHLILLPKEATARDVAVMREDALEAEAEGDLELAKQLWKRVLVVSPADPKAWSRFEKVLLKIANSGTSSPSEKPVKEGKTKGIVVPKLVPPPPKKSPAVLDNTSKTVANSPTQQLESFPFETITVNNRGEETKHEKGQAKYYLESLGDGVDLAMVAIPGGEFMMGSPEDEEERRDAEGPQHQVKVKPFFMGKYPVTQSQWQAVAKLPKVKLDLKPDPSRFTGKMRPVERVSWYEALEFCARLSRHTGKEYRLPSEAEWEYGCRGGTKTPFHFGETITTKLANYRGTDNEKYAWKGSYGSGPKGEYREETTPVDKFPFANSFGLYDLHGNVWEWCLDPWHENYQDAPGDSRVWDEKIKNDNHSHYISNNIEDLLKDKRRRLVRGGSWSINPRVCRSAYRNFNDADSRNYTFGFRLARSFPRTS